MSQTKVSKIFEKIFRKNFFIVSDYNLGIYLDSDMRVHLTHFIQSLRRKCSEIFVQSAFLIFSDQIGLENN